MIKIFDNIIPKKQQEELKYLLYGNRFPWYFVSDITHIENQNQARPGHCHVYMELGEVNSDYINEVKKISDNVNKKIKKKLKMHQVRSFLQLPLNEKLLYKDNKHREDTPHIDIKIPHTVFLYYVNDCDGDTLIYNYVSKNIEDAPFYENIKVAHRVTPKQGRVVVFDGMTWHSSTQPTQGPRCIVNFDMV
jgi:hypothetical protein|tara:strand:+ start:170 stop:742 length:573 start_codon:yes stop_codon:yes gene_type:complete